MLMESRYCRRQSVPRLVLVSVLQFIQAGLTLNSHEEYLQDDGNLRKAFLHFAVKVGKLLGGDNSTQQKMEAIYDFETSLAKVGDACVLCQGCRGD